MGVMLKLTLRHLKQNKKRTFVSIIGIVLAMALVSCVMFMASSLTEYLSRKEMAETGNYHYFIENMSYKNVNKVLEEKYTESAFLGKIIGDYVVNSEDEKQLVEKNNDKIKPKKREGTDELMVYRLVGIEDFDKIVFGDLIGRLPTKDDEIIISNRTELYLKVGDNILIDGKNYTVTGISSQNTYESKVVRIDNQMTIMMYTFNGNDDYSDNDRVNMYVKIKNDMTMNVKKYFDKIISLANPTDKLYTNEDVLVYKGIGKTDMINILNPVKGLIIYVISLCVIAMIKNVFNISLSERSSYIGMLSSVGATNTQKAFCIFSEGIILGLISIPIGTMLGYIATIIISKVAQSYIGSIMGSDISNINVIIDMKSLIIAIVIVVIILLISAYKPAINASKLTVVDAIRDRDYIITKKNSKSNKLVRILFGIEGELASKNLKRNKKKYKSVVFALSISVILFIFIYSFVFYMTKYMDKRYAQDNIKLSSHIFTNNYDDYINFKKDVKNMVKKEDVASFDITGKNQAEVAFVSYNIGNNNIIRISSKDYEKYDSSLSKLEVREVANYYVDEDYLRTLLDKNNISYDEFQKDKDNIIILNTTFSSNYELNNISTDNCKYVNCKKGDIINCEVVDNDGFYVYDKEIIVKDNITYKVFEILEETPLGVDAEYYSMPIIVTEQKYKELLDKVDKDDEKNTENNIELAGESFTKVYIKGVKFDKIAQELEKVAASNGISINIWNEYDSRKSLNDSILLIKFFMYSLLVVIVLISIANIINTVSTNMDLRKREFVAFRSVGMSNQKFSKMMCYETFFYGYETLLKSLPISIILNIVLYFLFKTEIKNMNIISMIPIGGYIIAVVAIFLIIGVVMNHSTRKISKSNIIDGLR